MKRLYLTVEGQTEEQFALKVVQPHLVNFNVFLHPPRFMGPHGRRRGRIPRGGDDTMAKWLQAWALIDLPRAERLFEQVLAEQRPRLTSECVQSCLLPMINLLTTPPADRALFFTAEQRSQSSLLDLPDD